MDGHDGSRKNRVAAGATEARRPAAVRATADGEKSAAAWRARHPPQQAVISELLPRSHHTATSQFSALNALEPGHGYQWQPASVCDGTLRPPPIALS